MYKIKPVVISLLLLICIAFLNAETVSSIDVQGLKRTKAFVVRDIIGVQIGDDLDSRETENIRQKLIKSGLFIDETIDVGFSDATNGLALSIYAEDRFSLIPIPMLSYSSSGLSGGLFVVDSNLLGRGHMMFAGGMISSDSRMIMTEFTDRSFQGSDFDLGFSLFYSDSAQTVTSVDEEEDLLDFDREIFLAGLHTTWNKGPFKVSLAPSAGFLDTSLTESREFMLTSQLECEYDALTFGDFFPRGLNMKLAYEYSLYPGDIKNSHIFTAGVTQKFIVNDTVQISLNADMGVSEAEEWLSSDLSRGMTGSILPDTVLADSYYRTGMDCQIVLADFSWGFLTLPLSYQIGILDGISGNEELFHGPSAGAALYLKKVAIPAVQINYAFNIETGTGVFSASIGMGG